MQDSGNDTLPVVELRPFCTHVWRRDRSFVDFYSRSSDTSEVGGERYLSHECLPNILEVLTEITQSSNKCKDEGLKRMRTKLHPKICNILTAPVDPKSPGIVPGFITKDDRTKTTFFWSRQDENPKSYSCRKQALNSATVRRQQQLQLQGGHLTLPENPPNQFVYLNPLANYKQHASLKQSKYRQSQQKHSSAPAYDRINHITSLPGKELDIARILQRRSPKPRLRPISPTGKSGEKRKGPVMHKSVTTVDFWRNGNKHSIIERNLGEERTFHIRRCRRTIDIGFTPLDILQHLQNQNALNTKLTQGEILLKKGKEANAIKLEAEPTEELPVSLVESRKPSKLLSIRRYEPCPVFKRSQTDGRVYFWLDETTYSDDCGGKNFQNCEKTADSRMSIGLISRKENHVRKNNESQNSSVGNVFCSYQNERVEDANLCGRSDEQIVLNGHTDVNNSSSTSKCFSSCNDGIQSDINDTPLIDCVAHINYDALLTDSGGSPVPTNPKILPKDTKGPHESPLVLRNDEGTSNSHALYDQYEKRSSRDISDWSDYSLITKIDLNQNGETSNFPNLDNGEAVESADGIPRRPKMCAYDDKHCVQHKQDNNASRITKDQLTHVRNSDVVECLEDVGGAILPSTTFLTTNV
ncbi:hypothetical protein SNE40_020000 [Patella caerulea]|uniref:Uncharacterized protein n=1 Tax=Patella caerulea TaxID=87958 RepID=A0AAN8G6N8_PATCE